MERASAHVRVPRVLEIRDGALVLEKIDGPTMAEALMRRPWTLFRQARLLARLHRDVAAAGLVHMDLNPTNVILSGDGPVVIDWTNAGEGRPEVDAALTYVILSTSGGRPLAWAFARCIDVEAGLAEAAAYRLADVNVTDAERVRVRRLLARRQPARAG